MGEGHNQLAAKIHRAARGHAERPKMNHQIGVVKRVKPLQVDPTDLDYVLDEDDVTLSQWVRRYHKEVKIKVGDNLVLHFVGNNWLAVDVISDSEI